ncbi:hypothetical protein JL721_11302 [Aureococcus anophagefferens]|nr:hypothetical protein JL721_11302 [Aureococcus anophagefferens]
MGKVIRGCRKGKGTIFTAHTRLRKGPVKLRKADYAEKTGYVKGVVKAIVHESGRGAPIAKVQFQNSYRFQRDNELFVAPQGLYEGAAHLLRRQGPARRGQRAAHLGHPRGHGHLQRGGAPGTARARCARDAAAVTHDEDHGTTKLRLPSGGKKTVKSVCRAMIGIVAGGGRTDKPMLKAGRAYHKYAPSATSGPRSAASP